MPSSTKAHTSLEIFDEQITKAYGQAVTHALIQKQPATRRAPFLGVGAMIVSRTIDLQAVDGTTSNIKGRPECTTKAYPDKVLDLDRILDLLKNGNNTPEFQRFINERVISSKEGVALTSVGPATVAEGVLTNLFVVKTGKKVKKIKFVGERSYGKRTLQIENARSAEYSLSFVLDRDFSNVLFVRLAPPAATTHTDLQVYESLFVFNQLMKFQAKCVPYPGVRTDSAGDRAADIHGVNVTKDIVEAGPTLGFLRKQFPLEFYFARGGSDKLQNKESIPYVNVFLHDLSRLHFTYDALVSIAGAMIYEGESPEPDSASKQSSSAGSASGMGKGASKAGADAERVSNKGSIAGKSSKNGMTKTGLDEDIVTVRAVIRRGLMSPVDPEYLRDVEDVQLFVAAAAEVISQIYVKKYTIMDGVKNNPNTASQLKVLSFADPASASLAEDALAARYGHFLAMRILADIPVDTKSNETTALEKKLGSPLQVTVRSVIPFSTINEYGEAWMLRVFYSAYHRTFLNLAAWVSPDKRTLPTWMLAYRIVSIMPQFRVDFFTDDGDYGGVIPVKLCMDHKIEIAVHTFIKNADGVNTKVLKDHTPAKRKPTSGWT